MIECSPPEETAVLRVCALAATIEELHYSSDPELSNRTKTILATCYRALKRVVDTYIGEVESPLNWNGAPGTPYTKQRKGNL